MRARRCPSAATWLFPLAALRRPAWFLAVALLPFAVAASSPDANPDKSAAVEKKADTADKKTGNSEKKEKVIPEPEDYILPTSDGLQLAMTYYAGPTYPDTKDKQIIPVVLLHMWKQSRHDFKELAPFLQKQGYAVLVPDLRGHGDSKRLKGDRRDETLNAEKMSPQQLPLMATEDMMAVKQFLWERNNKGELNIDKLCIVGAELGASVAPEVRPGRRHATGRKSRAGARPRV